jgi:hypothetical protein
MQYAIVYRKKVGGYSIEQMFYPLEVNAKEIIYLPFRDSNIFKILLNLIYLKIKKEKRFTYLLTGQIYYAALALKGAKVISVLHDLDSFNFNSTIKGIVKKKIFINLGLNYSSKVICVSKSVLNDFQKININKIPTSVINNYPIVHNKFDIINKKDIDFLLIGAKKNKFINESIKIILKTHPDSNIVAVSNKDYIENKLHGKVKILCNLSIKDLEIIYSKSVFLVFLSEFEGFGIPIIEAQSFGVIPIVRDKEPMMSVVGDSGLIFKSNNLEGNFKRLNDLSISDLNILKDKGKLNSEKYSLDCFVNNYFKAINE